MERPLWYSTPPPLTMRILSNLAAWSPTISLFVMFRSLRLGRTIKAFIKEAFSDRLKPGLLLAIPVVICGAMLLSVGIFSAMEGRTFSSYFSLGLYSLPVSILLSLLSGPTGEEAGWREYLRVELNRSYGFIKGSLLQGVVWTFWHTVLWFVDSEFLDWRFFPYVLSNLIVMTCLSVMMNMVLERHNNLIYAIWIHFCFNLPYSFLRVGIFFYIVMSVVFFLLAASFMKIRSNRIGTHANGGALTP